MQVQKGDVVGVRYTGRLDNGEVFDSNVDAEEPLEFRIGAGQVIAGFEDALVGLRQGESKTVRIPPEQAYGPRDDRLVTKLDKALFSEVGVEIGQHLDLEDEAGNTYHADVVAIDENVVTVDLNHHLAGQALTFELAVETIARE